MAFFYNQNGDTMKIYLDLVLFLNFAFDFLLLLSVSIALKRNANINKIILGAFIGSLSILFLFINVNSFTLFLFKVIISAAMIVVTFQYKNIRFFIKNISFFYMSSIILGGFLYALNIEFSYKNDGIIFYHNGLSINFLLLIILSPIIIYIYIKQCRSLKHNYNYYYRIIIHYKNQVKKVNSFLDTGNKLVSPYNKSPIILINKNILNTTGDHCLYIPYNTVNNEGVLKCIKVDEIIIEGVGVRNNVLVGLTDSIKIDDVDCILNMKLLEG